MGGGGGGGSSSSSKKRMVIDSRARNTAAYPTPARYEVLLEEDLFDVMSVTLSLADVPFPAYLVGQNRTSVPFTLPLQAGADTVLVATLAVGDYATPEELGTELEAAMTAAAAPYGISFLVSYVARTDGYRIRSRRGDPASSAPFTLAFTGRAADTPARVLGFGTTCDYASSPDGANGGDDTVVSPFRRDFGRDRYVVLKLSPNAEVLTSVSQPIDRTFAVVPISSDLNVVPDDAFVKRWSPPIGRVGRLVLEFGDAYGMPYDFQNQDHRIELTFELAGPPAFPS